MSVRIDPFDAQRSLTRHPRWISAPRAFFSHSLPHAYAPAHARRPLRPLRPLRLTATFTHLTAHLWRLLRAHPDAVLVLCLAAILRLSLLDQTSFLGDQAELLSLARSALDHHALPVTGIRSSIGSLNPPASVFFLLPFALLGNPLLATFATALANVAAVALLYRLVHRYAGRLAAFAAGMLYATAPWPVYFSRFIWQQNLLAPIVLLFIWTACQGAIERRPHWLGWNVLLWGLAVQLHPSAAPLLAITAVAVLFCWPSLHLRDFILAAAILVALFLPTLLWELASGGSDLQAFITFATAHSVINGDAFFTLLIVLSPPGPLFFGPNTLYAHVFPLVAWLAGALLFLFVLSLFWSLVMLLRAAYNLPALHRPAAQTLSLHAPHLAQRLRALIRAGRAIFGPHWLDARFLLIILLWQTLPLLAMFKHSTPIHEHYLLALLPAPFILLGLFLTWLITRLGGSALPALQRHLAPRLSAPTHATRRLAHAATLALPHLSGAIAHPPHAHLARPHLARPHLARSPLPRPITFSLSAITLLLALTQSVSVVAQLATIAQDHFDGAQGYSYTHYGMPLSLQQAGLSTAQSIAAPDHSTVLVATTPLQEEAFGYLATINSYPAQVYDASTCLLTPAADAAPATILLPQTLPSTAMLTSMQNIKLMRTLPGQHGAALRVYTVPSGSRLIGETPLASGSAVGPTYLSGYTLTNPTPTGAPQSIVVHWAGSPPAATDPGTNAEYWFGARPGERIPLGDYWFKAQAIGVNGQPIGGASAINCPILPWGRGEDVYTALTLPQLPAASGRLDQPHILGWRIWVERQALQVARPHVGPLTLETGDIYLGPSVQLPGSAFIALRP